MGVAAYLQLGRSRLSKFSTLAGLCSVVFIQTASSAVVPPAAETGNGALLALNESSSHSLDEIERLTKSILLRCVELERYNLTYRQNVAKQGRWKPERYFFFTESCNATSLASYIVGTWERGRNFITPKKLNRNVLESANWLGITSGIIGASGSAIELGINELHDLQARAKGYSPHAARENVLRLRSEIDGLRKEREVLVNALSSSGTAGRVVAVARAEGEILSDIEALSLQEFVTFHSSARRLLATQQSLYTLDIARNVCGAVSSRQGWVALVSGNRHHNFTSGLLSIVNGTLTMANPIVSRGIGKGVGEYQKHYVKATVSGITPCASKKLEDDVATLKRLTSEPYLEHCDLPLLRSALYSEHTDNVNRQLKCAEREQHAAALSATENIAAGTFVGGLKLAGGIVFTHSGIVFRRSSRKNNIQLGTSNILNLIGSSFATLDNARILAKKEYVNHKLGEQGLLPGQIVKRRLSKLDEMEKALKTQ